MSKSNKEPEDNLTVVNMNVDGMKNYVNEEQVQRVDEIRQLSLTKAEKRAIFWGAFKAVFPAIGFILVGFGLAALFCWWWLGRGI